MRQSNMQPTSPDLGVFIAALLAEIGIVLLGVIAMNGVVGDVLAAVAQFPSRAHDDETNEMTSRRKARWEFLSLVLFRAAPGIALMLGGASMVYWTILPLMRHP